MFFAILRRLHDCGIVIVIPRRFVSRNTYSCAFVGRSVTLSGIGLGLRQMMSTAQIPAVRLEGEGDAPGDANEVFGLEAGEVFAILSDSARFRPARNSLSLQSRRCSRQVAVLITIPQIQPHVPSSRSTRHTSRNTATMLATYSSGVGSRPS